MKSSLKKKISKISSNFNAKLFCKKNVNIITEKFNEFNDKLPILNTYRGKIYDNHNQNFTFYSYKEIKKTPTNITSQIKINDKITNQEAWIKLLEKRERIRNKANRKILFNKWSLPFPFKQVNKYQCTPKHKRCTFFAKRWYNPTSNIPIYAGFDSRPISMTNMSCMLRNKQYHLAIRSGLEPMISNFSKEIKNRNKFYAKRNFRYRSNIILINV